VLYSDGAVAPVSLADSSPAFFQNYYPQGGLALTSRFATYAAIYKAQVWVATLVNKLGFNIARLPLKVYARDDTNGRQDLRDSPYARLLRSPNSRHDAFFFWLWTASTFEVYGEAFWVKVRAYPQAPPSSLLPLHPSNVFTRPYKPNDTNGEYWSRTPVAGEYEHIYHIGNTSAPVLKFAESDVVHFRSYNPDNQVRGLSRLEPLRESLLTDDAIRRAQAAWYSNGARPSAYLTHPKQLSDTSAARLKAQWDSIHASVDNWGKTAILEEGMTANILQIDAQQMELINSLKLSREEACAVYDVPPPAVHILDHATFSNITEQMRSVYRDTMAPRLGLYESVLDAQLRPEFADENVYAEFLIDQVLRGDFEARVQAYETMFRIAGMSPAEIRAAENWPDMGPDTHRLYVNSATIPLGTAAGGNAPGVEVEIKPQAIKAVTVRSLMGRIGDAASLKDVNPALLVAGLNGEAAPVLAAYEKSVASGHTLDEFRRHLRALAQEAP
jgi:HK97 family phage portal protein